MKIMSANRIAPDGMPHSVCLCLPIKRMPGLYGLYFIRLLSELLNLIGFQGNKNNQFSKKNLFLKNHKQVESMYGICD